MSFRLLVLFACLFVVMLGYGITLAVLPFFVERLSQGGPIAPEAVSLHVGLLTAAYPLTQFAFAPLWGRWSDRIGRKPLVVLGLAGEALARAVFGLGTSLPLLYSSRLLGGILSSAVLPVAAAYVADTVPERERARGMAWMNLSLGLGVFAGPALSGLLTRRDWHFEWIAGHWKVDAFSVPFLAAAIAAGVLVPAVLRWLPESLVGPPARAISGGAAGWLAVGKPLCGLLLMVTSSQFGMALFMTTLALYASRDLDYGPGEVGAVFAICAFVEAAVQGGIGPLSRRIGERAQVVAGFAGMAGALLLLPVARSFAGIGATAAVLALGTGLISTNLLALISVRSRTNAGTALGLQGAARGVGQVAGPLVGSGLFVWSAHAPFVAASALMAISAAWLVGRGRRVL